MTSCPWVTYLVFTVSLQDQKILDLMMKRRKDEKMDSLKNAIVEQVTVNGINIVRILLDTMLQTFLMIN